MVVLQIKSIELLTVLESLDLGNKVEGEDEGLEINKVGESCDTSNFVVKEVNVSDILHIWFSADTNYNSL